MGMVISPSGSGTTAPSSGQMAAMLDGANSVSAVSVSGVQSGFLVEYHEHNKTLAVGVGRVEGYADYLVGPYGKQLEKFYTETRIPVKAGRSAKYVYLAATVEYKDVPSGDRFEDNWKKKEFAKPYDVTVTKLDTGLFGSPSPAVTNNYIVVYNDGSAPSGDSENPYSTYKGGCAKYNVWVPLASFVQCDNNDRLLSPLGAFTYVTPLYTGTNVIKLPGHKYLSGSP